jgi:hypothetical protein
MTWILTGLLRATTRMLPVERRDWAEAVWADARDVPPGWDRLSWLLGGLRIVGGEARLGYRATHVIVFAAGVTGILWIRSTGGLTPVAAGGVIGIGVMLVTLPWIRRRNARLGPVGRNLSARIARVGAYATIMLFLVAGLGASHYAGRRFGVTHPHGSPGVWVPIFVIMTAYVVAVLFATAQGSQVPVAAMTVGVTVGAVAGLGVYALAPYGGMRHVHNPLISVTCVIAVLVGVFGAPVLAGALAARRVAAPVDESTGAEQARFRAALFAGALAGGAMVLVLSALTVMTLFLMPQRVALEWANPDPHAPHGTPFEIEMSVADSIDEHLGFLVVGPFGGLALSVVGVAIVEGIDSRGRSRQPSPQPVGVASP